VSFLSGRIRFEQDLSNAVTFANVLDLIKRSAENNPPYLIPDFGRDRAGSSVAPQGGGQGRQKARGF
jgi:hypothetical protein